MLSLSILFVLFCVARHVKGSFVQSFFFHNVLLYAIFRICLIRVRIIIIIIIINMININVSGVIHRMGINSHVIC
jgi:hypothetical protein